MTNTNSGNTVATARRRTGSESIGVDGSRIAAIDSDVRRSKHRKETCRSGRQAFLLVASLAFAATLASGCASSAMTASRSYTGDEKLPKPNRIIVHDFAATAKEMAADSGIKGEYETRPQTESEIALGRELGSAIADELVKRLVDAGLPAERAGSGPPPAPGNLEILGEFLSIDEGNRARRVVIGFGAGAAEVKTLAEVFQVTADGRRPVASAEFTAEGGKMPGMLVPVASGAAAGKALTATAVSGTIATAKEFGPESVQGLASKTADRMAEKFVAGAKKRGWID